MVWKEAWREAHERTGIVPAETKDDLRKIALEALRQLNLDKDLRENLSEYVKTHLYRTRASFAGYKPHVTNIIYFLAWMSERLGRTLTLRDFEPPRPGQPADIPGTVEQTADAFVVELSPESPSVQAQAKNALKMLTRYLKVNRRIGEDPFIYMKAIHPSDKRVVIYDAVNLDEFFNVILIHLPEYYPLFFRLFLQTGARPEHLFPITCGDIGDKPVVDALDRKFYKIELKKMALREKAKKKEWISGKLPAEAVYISEKLREDLLGWCKSKSMSAGDYMFANLLDYKSMAHAVHERAKRSLGRLSRPVEDYFPYVMRHTWASVLYAVTGNTGLPYLKSLGGWEESATPMKYYAGKMGAAKAFPVAERWEIYLPPEMKAEIIGLKKSVEAVIAAPPPPTAVSRSEYEGLLSVVSELRKEIAELRGGK